MEHIIFESSSTKLSLDNAIDCMCLQIKGYIKEDEFKEILTKALNHFPQLKGTVSKNKFYTIIFLRKRGLVSLSKKNT